MLTPRELPDVLGRLHARGRANGYLMIAPYLGPEIRQRLREAGVSYADGTGNIRITLDRPALLLELQGAPRNPWAEDRPVKSLRGPAAAAVVRALCDFRPPYGVRQLAQRARLSLGSTSRIAALLDSEALITRAPRGGIESVDWPRLVHRWTQDYGFVGSNRTRAVLEPRGLQALMDKVRGEPGYVITGSLAASLVVQVAPSVLAALYVPGIAATQRDLGLRDAPTGANVLLVEPLAQVSLERTRELDGIRFAALSQVAADLLDRPRPKPLRRRSACRVDEGERGCLALLTHVYAMARRALLDALDALAHHRDSLILVGAQAVYLHAGDADLAVAPYTKDADLAIDPRRLRDHPALADALLDAGFHAGDQPGIWRTQTMAQVDLLVPDSLGGSGRHRGADLEGHGRRAARRVVGLEGALVDNTTMSLTSLDPSDERSVAIRVAGPAALLVSKLHKLGERRGQPDRLADKDALDVYRLLVTVSTADLANGLRRLRSDAVSAAAAMAASGYLAQLFGAPDSLGSQMAARAVVPLLDPATVSRRSRHWRTTFSRSLLTIADPSVHRATTC